MIPTPAECYALMSQYEMLDNIRAHSLVVAKISEFLGRQLKKSGLEINLDLLVSGALLHDIAKTASLHNGQNHALLGADICRKHAYDELAPLVAQHVILPRNLPEIPDVMQLVYYADKRVNHDQVVSLGERLAYIIERYGKGDAHRCAMIRRNFKRCYNIEKAIFSYLEESPADLADLLPQNSEFERYDDDRMRRNVA